MSIVVRANASQYFSALYRTDMPTYFLPIKEVVPSDTMYKPTRR